MLKDPLVQALIHDIIDEEEEGSITIVDCLIKGKVTDEEIAEETELRLNIVRRVLYKLYDAGLASYKRSKDPETQWYTYTWKFEEERVEEMITKRHGEIVANLKSILEFEENNMFFACKTNDCRCTFDEASENGFICPKCDGEMEYMDNSPIIAQIKEELSLYENSGYGMDYAGENS
ncbi:transcription factor E [Methanobacterium alcaliphilum]|uniref:transcription factor E n=1 Tax=Methanobacterium alcaliphilum TaxID=392018 RepID=UPI00200A9B1C|nr:transcription factor E [Methanobacterium alcaliphilum]MCK9152220.1 transcription factor E [Methanobacterium alcaliphilum]